jgi:hypothetical protein
LELESVSVEILDGKAKISWQIKSADTAVKAIYVERNFNNGEWLKISGALPANYFYFLDNNLFIDGTYRYRLEAKLTNGKNIILTPKADTAKIAVDCLANECSSRLVDAEPSFGGVVADSFFVSGLSVTPMAKNKNIAIAVEKKTADEAAQTIAAQSSLPLSIVGNNIFNVSASDPKTKSAITDFSQNPLTLTFDISGIPASERAQLRVAWYDSKSGQWEIIANQEINGDELKITVNHLSEFALVDRLPVGQLLDAYISCQSARPFLNIRGWSYDPDNLAMGAAETHIYDKTFTQANYKFLFSSKNSSADELGQKTALKDMAMLRTGKTERYQPVAGAQYGFLISKPLPYSLGDEIDPHGYALNFDSYGNRVKRNSHLSRRAAVKTLTVPDCSATGTSALPEIKPAGQIMDARFDCRNGQAWLTVRGWSYDPNNLAYGVPQVHIYDRSFEQTGYHFLFNSSQKQNYDEGYAAALQDMANVHAGQNEPYQPATGAHYGFSISRTLPDSYAAEDIIEVNAYALNIDSSGAPASGNAKLGRPFAYKLSLAVPRCAPPAEPGAGNSKNEAAYYDKDVFLISDLSWQNVMSLVPVAVWDNTETWCQRGSETADKTCSYPVLIFHEESENFDADSIIHFFNQYQPARVTIIGTAPQLLQDLLIAASPFGAGLESAQVRSLRPDELIANYWHSFDYAVYVENIYASALIAAPYASLINAPLIISGNASAEERLTDKNVICVGDVSHPGLCDIKYTAEELQKIYAAKTQTDKLIIVNPQDLNINMEHGLWIEKGSQMIETIYGNNSLAAPFLASAKHEAIITVSSDDYREVKAAIQQNVSALMPQIINNTSGMVRDNFSDPVKKIYHQALNSGDKQAVEFLCGTPKTKVVNGKFVWWDCNHTYVYDPEKRAVSRFKPRIPDIIRYSDSTDTSAVYAAYNSDNKKCTIYRHVFATDKIISVASYDGICNQVLGNDEYIVWEQMGAGRCYLSGGDCNNYTCSGKFCFSGRNGCTTNAQCGANDICISDVCLQSVKDIYIKGVVGLHTIRTISVEDLQGLNLAGNKLVWTEKNPEGSRDAFLYQINSGRDIELVDIGNINIAQAGDKNLLWSEGGELYLYDIEHENKKSISSSVLWNDNANRPMLTGDTVLWSDIAKVYAYDINSGGTRQVYEGEPVSFPAISGNDLFYVKEEKNIFYISGFLTIIGPEYAIPYRDNMDAQINNNDNYRALDQTEYADVFNNDRYPDMSTGRIQGLTIADVSSYIARDLFQADIFKTNGVLYAMREGFGPPAAGNDWTTRFKAAGYNASCVMEDTPGISMPLCPDVPATQWPPLWQNRDFVYYSDHGGYNWAGIYSNQIPELNSPVVIGNACLTCSESVYNSFCSTAIRRGALAYFGAVSIAYSNNLIYTGIVNGIFYDNIPIGSALAKSYIYNDMRYMTTMIGDPTLNVRPPYLLTEKLP